MESVHPVLIVLTCFSALMGALAVAAAAYCVVQVRPLAVRERDLRLEAVEAAIPAWSQRMETMQDAASADLEEAQRQRQRASNVRAGSAKRGVDVQAPQTRGEVLALVKQRYGA